MRLKDSINIFLILFLISCSSDSPIHNHMAAQVQDKLDQHLKVLNTLIPDKNKLIELDHSRMAIDENVYTPPSIVTIFSRPKVNARILQKSQVAGIDLPFKILLYSEPDTQKVSLAYTSAEFIQQRHQLTSEDVKGYKLVMDKIVSKFPPNMVKTVDLSKVDKGFGLRIIKSEKDFLTSIKDLKAAIGKEGDTRFFADINYQAESKKVGVDIPPTYLILFGGPAPGGKAMHTTPRLGLDAFCQKLLVYETKEGEVFIAFNDIVDFSELYYDTWTIPQRFINFRLGKTLGGAVE
ncbi:DUF302 domain-containing protein [Flammeovirga sp. SubArs3]|uniref:DUF302 domain-containing protein n=1 Tax=Flammeovirga sp. SubArs3 TaxID=2995316 RepID=UPI00248AA78D|nr:DUF302 domain-containing protein [Flammeovirga sp. SubArs3]